MNNGIEGWKEKGNKKENEQNKTLSHYLVAQLQSPPTPSFFQSIIVFIKQQPLPSIKITVKTTVYLLMGSGFKNEAGDTMFA